MRCKGLYLAGLLLLMASGRAMAQTDAQVAAEVMALAKAQWAAEMAGQPASVSMKDAADEYTEFNSDFPTRIDGKGVNGRLADGFASAPSRLIAAEMANPKVQVYGNVAILSYNFIGLLQEADGSVEPSLAKSTRVYAQIDGAWKLVHANFAPVEVDD